jgi:hypothetical protein
VVILTKKVIITRSSKKDSIDCDHNPINYTSFYSQTSRLLTKVQTFLKSVSRNSERSAAVYEAGIIYFYSFLTQGLNHSVETILDPLGRSEINVYELFDGFVAFLMSSGLSIPSIRLYVSAIRSYLAYHDIDVIPSKFKRKVRMPRLYREDEQPLDAQDVRKSYWHVTTGD